MEHTTLLALGRITTPYILITQTTKRSPQTQKIDPTVCAVRDFIMYTKRNLKVHYGQHYVEQVRTDPIFAANFWGIFGAV